MATYLLRRAIFGVGTLLVITCFVYGLARNMPGTPLTAQLGEDPSRKLNPEDQERMRRIYGLDKPWYTGYAQWLGNVARGDLGRSITRKQPVTTLIAERIGPTFLISGTALVLIWIMAIPLGLYASARSGTARHQITRNAEPESSSVGPRRSRMSVVTGCLRVIDRPRSPRTTLPSHCT